MKLRTALKIITVTKYLIVGTCEGEYGDMYLIVDYHAPLEELIRKLGRQRQLLRKNPKVKYIDYNHAEECVEITIM